MVCNFRTILVACAALLACHASEPTIREQQIALLQALEAGFVKRDLGHIPNPTAIQVSIQIEHSLIEPPKGIKRARFRSFKQVEKWLRAHERFHDDSTNEHHPFREVRKGEFTAQNLFEYDNMGINHNTWYLSQVYFTQIEGRAVITKIVIYDGD